MTENERELMDAHAKTFLKTCIQGIDSITHQISLLSTDYDDRKADGVDDDQISQHLMVIVEYLRNRLSKVSEFHMKQQQMRAMQLIFHHSSSIMNDTLFPSTPETLPEKLHFKQQQQQLEQVDGEELNSKDRMLFQLENKDILDELMGLETELGKVEKSLLEISELQSQLEMHIQAQSQTITRLYDEAEQTTEKVMRGNAILHKISTDGLLYRNYLIFILLLFTLVMLFLHWYND